MFLTGAVIESNIATSILADAKNHLTLFVGLSSFRIRCSYFNDRNGITINLDRFSYIISFRRFRRFPELSYVIDSNTSALLGLFLAKNYVFIQFQVIHLSAIIRCHIGQNIALSVCSTHIIFVCRRCSFCRDFRMLARCIIYQIQLFFCCRSTFFSKVISVKSLIHQACDVSHIPVNLDYVSSTDVDHICQIDVATRLVYYKVIGQLSRYDIRLLSTCSAIFYINSIRPYDICRILNNRIALIRDVSETRIRQASRFKCDFSILRTFNSNMPVLFPYKVNSLVGSLDIATTCLSRP